ncbi:EF-hand domain-containing protein [Aliiruegeria sabulilitoris]|uniref:EF-hand domain-containing protein n=1 Tax=Aliiruegeria sabulilitoris TaxID=1510458 RepID=UPI0008336F68|nr:EF-hand domain-containing protein [Aliiruegeria sabulilitoris]
MTRIVLLTTAIVTGLVAANSAVAFGGPMGPGERPGFTQIDTDGDGKISAEELKAFPAARATERFKAADADGDGKISKEEMAAEIETMRAARENNRLDNMIARFDTDKDGFISQEEMEAAMGQGRAQRDPGDRMMRFADTDKDGAISEAEYAAMAERMQQRGDRFGGKRGDRDDFGKRGEPGERGMRGGRGDQRGGDWMPFWRN